MFSYPSLNYLLRCYLYKAKPSLIDKSEATRAIDKAKKTCVFVSIYFITGVICYLLTVTENCITKIYLVKSKF